MNLVLLILCGLIVAAFFVALRAKWFARLEGGFRVALILAAAGMAVVGGALAGVLSYRSGRQIVLQEITGGLSAIGDVVEENLKRTIGYEIEQLHEYADFLAPELNPDRKAQLTAELFHMDQLNKEIVQISAYDQNSNLLATSHVTSKADSMGRVAVATALDGNDYVSDAAVSPISDTYVLIVATPIKDKNKAVIGALAIRYDLQGELSSLIQATRFPGDGSALVASSTGRILAAVDPKRINMDISGWTAFQQTRGGPGYLVTPGIGGERTLWAAKPIHSPASGHPPPWALLVEMSEANVLAPIGTLRNQVLLAIAIVSVAGILIGWSLGLSISGPVSQLVQFVKKVQGGDFTGSVAEGRDEIGHLGAALNQMTRGLAERDRVKELFGRYVATQVSDRIVKGEIGMAGESRRVTILFSDIRDFTAMSELMTPAQVVAFLNDYFSEMVEAVFEQGGVLDKFIGDGLMAVFGSINDMPDHPRRAVLTALRMKSLLGKINGERAIHGKPPIGIGIGIHTAEVIVGNIGSRKRLEYTVIGDGVNTCSRVQALNKEFGTTILITEDTWAAVQNEFDCREMPAKELRGKIHAMKFYEVLSVKAAATVP